MKDLTEASLFYINLDKRVDRRKQFESQDALVAMPSVQRIPAIHGLSVDIKNDKRIGTNTKVHIITEFRRSHYEIHSRNAIGASLSHYKAWEEFLKTDSKYALIMEDDAKLPSTFALQVRDCAKDLPDKWDIWILGSTNTPIDTHNKDILPFRRVLHFIGAHCYILTRSAARVLIDNMFPIEAHVEHYMNNIAYLKGLSIIRDIRLNLPQHDRVLNISDIRKPDGCIACNVDDKQDAMEARRLNMS